MRCFALVSLLLSAAAADAAFLSPEQAGFHDCRILLQREQARPDDVLPYVAYTDREGRPTGWMFDAFMIGCEGIAPSGAVWADGMATAADWRAYLDRQFDRTRGFAAVQDGVTSAAHQLGAPPTMRQAVVAIPALSPAQHDFGDINGDGRTENLSLPQDRDRVLRWYVDEVARRFQAAGFSRLSLWGFCWSSEELEPADAVIVRRLSSYIRTRQLKLLWTPSFRAPGWDRWRELGFDAAVLRPGYADDFREGARANRLIEAGELAQQEGLGIAIEAPYALPDLPRAREVFQGYLSYGAPLRGGYVKAARVHSDSFGLYAQLARSPDAEMRALYDSLAAFVRGEDVPLAGAMARVAAKRSVGGASTDVSALVDGQVWTRVRPRTPTVLIREAEETVTLDFAEQRAVDLLEVSVRRVAGESWQGRIVAEAPTADGSGWRAVGWCRADVARGPDSATYKAVLDVPVFAANTRQVRLTFSRQAASGGLQVDEILTASPSGPPPAEAPGIALGAPYWIRPDVPRAYPNAGRALTDGQVSSEGAAADRAVGWSTADETVGVLVDLGAPRVVDTVRVRCEESIAPGGRPSRSPAAQFPGAVSAELWTAMPESPFTVRGRGASPEGAPRIAMIADPTKLVVDAERTVGGGFVVRLGHIDLTTPEGRPASTRYILVRMQRRRALLVSEIEVLSGGRGVGVGAKYTFWPPATPEGRAFCDDGTRLTDGEAASVPDPDRLVELPAGRDSVIVVDLGRLMVLREVGALLVASGQAIRLAGGYGDYRAPESATMSLSADGVEWRDAGRATPAAAQDDRPHSVALVAAVRDTRPCRFVAVRLKPGAGKMALGEVVVR